MLRMMDKELYQAVLLQHSKCPRNFGLMEDSTHRSEGHNALCGDEISVTLKIEKEVVSEVKFTGSACVICTASASMMTNEVKGMACNEVKELTNRFRLMTQSGANQDLPQKLEILAGVYHFPQRVKCAVLPWETLIQAIESPVS
jgi:nitrogen fixation NifU-like protein